MKMIRKTAKIAAIVAAASLVSGAAMAQFKPLEGDPKEINFGIISTESTQNLKQAWVPSAHGGTSCDTLKRGNFV